MSFASPRRSIQWMLWFLCIPIASTNEAANAETLTKSLPIISDTTLRVKQSHQNRGSDELIRLGWAQGSRGILSVDHQALLDAVGEETLASAHLELMVEATGGSWQGETSQEVGVHRVEEGWSEVGATWSCPVDLHPGNNRADCAVQWNGGTYRSIATAIVQHRRTTDGLARFDVTEDVSAFLDGTSNNGWILRKRDESLAGRIDYVSREGELLEQTPRLVLVLDISDEVDLERPTLEIVSPSDGVLASAVPEIVASFSDLGSGIDVSQTMLYFDGEDHSADAQVSDSELRWTPPQDLVEGPHYFEVTVQDNTGNPASESSWFVIDRTPPSLMVETPLSGTRVNLGQVRVSGSARDENLLGLEINGQNVSLDEGLFAQYVPLVEGEQAVTIRATDSAGNSQEESILVTRVTIPEVSIDSPQDLSFLSSTTVTVQGTVSLPNVSVAVNGLTAVIEDQVFTAVGVPLAEGGNLLTATVTDTRGNQGTDTVQVVRDLTAPRLVIHEPEHQSLVFEPTVAVSGMVNDIVAGTVNGSEASVEVNGVLAQVANRSFLVSPVPVEPGENTIKVTAQDASGNRSEVDITVFRAQTPAARLVPVAGDLQVGTIGTLLAEPLAIQALDSSGQPIANRAVLFKIIKGSGYFGNGRRQVVELTDPNGGARVSLTLGSRSGPASHLIEVSSSSLEPAVFRASAQAGAPAHLFADGGALQVGIAGQALPRPLVAVVTDAGFNRLADIDVALWVVQGGGLFANGTSQTVATTDSDGRILVPFTLGPEEGISNNVIGANVVGFDENRKIAFVASGLVAGNPADTSISGVVLDNTNEPIPGVTLWIREQPDLISRSDGQGRFQLVGVPVGSVHLVVDGSTAEREGSWPGLEHIVTTISGRDVSVNMPIYLLPLDLDNGIHVDENRGGVLTMPSYPGFSLEIAPGSVTFPDGSRNGLISATAVHSDKIPMVPNFGQQPRFVVTIQPSGARFEPPARLTFPNLEGLEPGATTELYSFDHDLSQFVSIGPGSVSEDGLTISSDPGVGLIKAGWHCGGDPSLKGTPADCPTCQFCDGTACVAGCLISDAPESFAAKKGCNCTNPGEVCFKGQCTCAVPTNFREIERSKRGNGDIYFKYTWDSSTGRRGDLGSCIVGEQVFYDLANINPDDLPMEYEWPKPWTGRTPNPTVITGSATGTFMEDTHEPHDFEKPDAGGKVRADQRYFYICPCANDNKPVSMMGPHPILREIVDDNGTWKYRISKTGLDHEVEIE